MILFISDSRESLPIAHRIMREGVPVSYYVHDQTYRDSFKGILPTIGLDGLIPALKRCEVVVFDITLPMRHPPKPHDLALLNKFGVKPGRGVFGVLADRLKEKPWNKFVIGSCEWCERIELDRVKGIELAGKLGFSIPEYHQFTSLKDGVKFLTDSKDKWVFKPLDNKDLALTYVDTFKGELLDLMQTRIPAEFKGDAAKYILQKFVDGVEISSELWWDGENFLNPNRTLEDKKLSDGNCGPATGSQSNTVWMCDSDKGVVFDGIKGLKKYLSLADYCGPVDANCILSEDGQEHFLEWTPRMGWSALYCLCAFIPKGQLSQFFLNGFQAKFKSGYVASQLVSLYPYPNLNREMLNRMVKDNLINHSLDDPDMWWQDTYRDGKGQLRCAGADGIVGVLTYRGEDAEGAITGLHKKLKKLEISGELQYRTEHDHLTRALERLDKLEKWGITVN